MVAVKEPENGNKKESWKDHLMRLVLAAAFLVSPILVQTAFACSCIPKPSLQEEFNRAAAVFTGQVLSTLDVPVGNYNERRHVVSVKEVFKGLSKTELTISAGVIDSSCFIDFYKNGQSYLIYAYQDNDGVYTAGVFCSRTTRLENAKTQIHFIREFVKGKTEPVLYGSVSMVDGLLGIPVVLESRTNQYRTITDKDGIFRFGKLANGKYQIAVQVPAKYSFWSPVYSSVEISNNQVISKADYIYDFGKAAFVQFNLRWNTGIDVKLVDGEGKAINKADLNLIGVSADGRPVTLPLHHRLGSNEFSVRGIEPGDYRLVAEMPSPLGQNSKLKFEYANANSNSRVSFGETSNQEVVFSLPKEARLRSFRGEVVTETGGSVGGFVNVSLDSLEDMSSPDNTQFARMSIDAKGQFRFEVLEGEEYWLHIWVTDIVGVNGPTQALRKILKTEKVRVGNESQPQTFAISLPPKEIQ
jgi:hypothetical protein